MTGEKDAPAEMPDCRAASNSDQTLASHEPAIGETQPVLRSTAATQAPAEMPGVEEIAELLVSAHASLATPQNTARAVLALFAQKAVKPPTREDDAASSEIAVQSQLAAEAALAETNLRQSERIRQLEAALAGLRQNILDADIICDDDEKAGDRLARLADHIRAQVRAAAIRAEGE